MKFSFSYVKKNPLMFGAIFVVFGLLIWLLLNSGSGGSSEGGSTSYISTGPSPDEVAAQVALGTASIAANSSNVQAQVQLAAIQSQNQTEIAIAQSNNSKELAIMDRTGQLSLAALEKQSSTELALAGLTAQINLESIAANREIQNNSLNAQLSSLAMQYGSTVAMQRDSNATMAAIYRDANATAVENTRINANLQATLSAHQADAYKTGALMAQIPTLKKGDRDNALVTIATGASYKGDPAIGSGIFNAPVTVQAF